jgi:acetyl esterase/lipase
VNEARGLARRAVLAGLGLAGAGLGSLAGCGHDDRTGPGRSSMRVRRITYGEDPSQFGDLHLPDDDPLGVVVVLHGGFWRSGYDHSLGTPLAEDLAARGWAAWNVEYRRIGSGPGGGGGAPATFDDVAAAIDVLAEQDLDLGTLLAVGHSAGGHLATWAASRTRHARWAGGVELTGVVSQAGVLDLRRARDEGVGGTAVSDLLGGPDVDAAYDPRQQIPLDVTVWCVHGREDDVVPISQSEGYVEAASAAGGRAELVAVEGDHLVLIDPESAAWRRTVDILAAASPRPSHPS